MITSLKKKAFRSTKRRLIVTKFVHIFFKRLPRDFPDRIIIDGIRSYGDRLIIIFNTTIK